MPAKIRAALVGHQVFTARQMGWDRLQNGDLLKAAETSWFNVLLTADQSIFYQQNNSRRRIALVVLSTNDWEIMRHHIDPIDNALDRSTSGSFELVRLPRFGSTERT